jgi:hypothetical protein
MAPSYGQKREGPKHHPGLSTLSKRLSNPCSHQVDGHAERVAALYLSSRAQICRRRSRWVSTRLMTTEDFVNELRSMKVTPHVAQNTDGARRRSMAARRAMTATLAVSQRIRNRIEEAFPADQFRRCDRIGWVAADADCRSRRRRQRECTGALPTHRRRRIVKADICDRQHLAICSR